VAAVANVAVNLDSRGVPAKLKQIADRGKEVDRSLNGAATASIKAANNIRKTGNSAVGAAAKLKSFGAALNSALGPIGLALSGLAGLSAAFQTLQQQDFAEAKVRSLGTNSEQLVTQLKSLSTELKGQASVTQLTAAAYDVASAGFVNAADAVNVLKAASLGAVGGFSDINTVGNAATSVLNAYEMSAANATSVVDKFIQTQNDGKIVVAEYAQNIGKVASAAAGLGIPLEEINAVIAQATASGVQAEVAFTGLKGALARLASGEASNALKGIGIDISAASLESDGLLGTLQKLQGLDTGQIFKALGTEAGPALLPVLNNLERYEELINRQKNSTGAAARAQSEAANTIQGALTRLQTAFQNAFADQSSLGEALKVILLGAAVTVEALASAFDLIIAPIEAVSAATGAFGKAIADVLGIDSQQQLQDFEQGWQSIRSGIETASNVIAAFGQATGQLLADLTITAFQFGQDLIAAFEGPINAITGFWQQFSRFVVSSWNNAATSVNTTASNLWASISGGVRGIIGAIGQAFSDAFTEAFKQIKAFYNQLPGWLRGALQGAANVGSAVTGAVQSALGKVGVAFGEASETLNRAFTPPAVNQGTGGGRQFKPDGEIGGGGAGGGGGTGGGGAGRSAEDILKDQLAAGERIAKQLQREINLRNASNDLERELLGIKFNYEDVVANINANAAERQREELLNLAERNRLDQENLATIEARDKRLQEAFKMDFASLFKQDQGKLQQFISDSQDSLKDLEQVAINVSQGVGSAISSSLVNGIQGLIEGSAKVKDVFANMLKSVGQVLAQEGARMIATYIAIGVAKAFAGLSGGTKFGDMGNFDQAVPGASGFSSPSSFDATGLFGARANGGPVNANQPYIVGERGPELFMPFSSGMVLSNNDTREQLEQQDAVMSDNATREQLEQQDAAMRDSATREQLEQQDAVLRSNETTRQQLIKQQNTIMRSNEATRQQLIKQQNTMTTNRIREVERTSLAMLASPDPIDVRYESSVINNVEYVTAEQHRKGMAQAAERGRALTLEAMQNSVKFRRKGGI